MKLASKCNKVNDTEGKANNLLLLIFHHVFFHTCFEI